MKYMVLSIRDAGRVEEMLRHYERHKNDKQPYRGRPIIIEEGGADIKIFEIQSIATGDGVYNCREEQVLNAEWEDTEGDAKTQEKNTTNYEVLNLNEHDPEAGQHNLSAGDFLVGFQVTDDTGAIRWVGINLSGGGNGEIRRAKITALNTSTISAKIDDDGDAVTVKFHFTSAEDVTKCIPLMIVGKWISIYKDPASGYYYCTDKMQEFGGGLEIVDGVLKAKIDTTELKFEDGKISTKIAEC